MSSPHAEDQKACELAEHAGSISSKSEIQAYVSAKSASVIRPFCHVTPEKPSATFDVRQCLINCRVSDIAPYRGSHMPKSPWLAVGLAVLSLAFSVPSAFAQKVDASVLYRQDSDVAYH